LISRPASAADPPHRLRGRANRKIQRCSIARDDQFHLKNLLDRDFEQHHLKMERRLRQGSLHRPDRNKENRNDYR
jgi:hypothetical protein